MKIIIIGAGEVGFHIAEKLTGENAEVTVIDTDAERLHQLEEQLDAQFLQGSGSSPNILKRAGISQAGMVIAVSNQDEVNLVACLVAQHFSPGSVKIARMRDPAYLGNPDVFSDLKLDLFINPEYAAAEKLVRLLDVPQAMDIIHFADGRVMMAGFKVETGSLLAGRKMFSLKELADGYAPLVTAIYRGKELIIPRGADSLAAGDIVYFAVTPENMPKLMKLIGKKPKPVENVMIYGGDNTGLYLAQMLEKRKGIDVKIIEEQDARCTFLADRLSRTTVLHGEGKDAELLEEENVHKMDVFVAVSKDPENNILASLLAKSLGARFAMILSNRVDYASLVPSLGIDAVVSPQLAAVSQIVRFLRKGKVTAVEAIREKDAEGIEFVALETSDLVGKPLQQIKFPNGALVIAVVRGAEVIVPTGGTVILPEDRVVIFAKRDAIPKVQKLFSVKLQYF